MMLLAVAPEVQAAALGTVGVLGAAAIGVLGESIRRNAKATREAVGTPNGEGNAIQLLERILAGQAGQDNRLARLERNQHALQRDVARLAVRIDVLEQQRVAAPTANQQED